jgi:hypothetical protein
MTVQIVNSVRTTLLGEAGTGVAIIVAPGFVCRIAWPFEVPLRSKRVRSHVSLS